MASRKMTFTVPEEVAEQFMKRVPARRRSSYVAEAITYKLKERDRQLMRACEAANKDADVLAIEQEMDALTNEIMEPWIDTPAR
jgi:ubiquinone biosynthesis protein UbiJ